jgi:hypothetical protein
MKADDAFKPATGRVFDVSCHVFGPRPLNAALALMDRDWLYYATGIGAVATPLLVLFLSGLGWHIKTRLAATRARDARMEERIKAL